MDLAVLAFGVCSRPAFHPTRPSVAKAGAGQGAPSRRGGSDHVQQAELGHTEGRRCPLPESWLGPGVEGLESGCWGTALPASAPDTGGREPIRRVVERGFGESLPGEGTFGGTPKAGSDTL